MLTYAILGPLEIRRDGVALELAGQRQRALLVLLLLSANEVVPSERLVDRLWGEHPPPTATTSLQNGISQLRKVLGQDAVETRAPGYRLRAEPAQLDLLHFEALTQRARGEAPAGRARTLAEALDLWRGEPLAEFAFEQFAQDEIRRLEELRLAAIEERFDAELEADADPPGSLVSELEQLVRAFPLRERLRAHLMRALYRTGRQAEALQAYHDARRKLVDELGIEPSPPLQRLFAQILRQESTLDPDDRERVPADGIDDIAEAIAAGRLVPVLGTSGGISAADVSTNARLAAALNATFGGPSGAATDLTRVAQYVAVTHGVGRLYDELHELFEIEAEPGPAHRFLAALPAILRERGAPQQLIVTTAWDTCLERAFADAGEALDVVSYLALGPDRGKFLHRRADGRTEVIQLPNAYTDVPLGERPVLLKVHGEVDLSATRDWESFVVSEDDYIGYLAQTGVAGGLPVTLAARLRRSHFLFLGYGVVDWSLRVFLHRLWPDLRIGYRSWAVERPPATLEQEFWRPRGVEPVLADIEGYVDRLHERIVASGHA